MVIPRGAPARRGLAHNEYSELAYNEMHLDDHPEQVNSLYGSYSYGHLSGSPLKDGDSPTMTFWSQPTMGCNLMAAPEQVNSQHRSYPDGYPSGTLNKQRYKVSYRNIKSSNSTPKENGGHISLLHLFLQKEASSFCSTYKHCLDPSTIPEISHVSRQSF